MKGNSLSIGIVGLPNVGKSTLFSAITKKQVDCANYPFCTIEPNIGVVAVSDKRLDALAELLHAVKKIYATIEFIDIAGLVKGAHKGEGLGNQFLAHIREADAIVYLLRLFPNTVIVNTQPAVDPIKEKEILDTELALKDLETLEKRAGALEKEVKAGSKESLKESGAVNKALNFLKEGLILNEQEWDEEERKILKNYQLLTLKPRLYLLNGEAGEKSAASMEFFKKNNLPFLVMDVLAEQEVIDFSAPERESLGLSAESQLEVLIKKSYELLELITFFTTLSSEHRAWPIKKGTKIPQAGGVIHSDFEKNFIRAEVIVWQNLLNVGGFGRAREKGLIRTEGKEYVVQDGDVIVIKSGA
ncbi:redox-regulated ATPase YchF [Patescibacteria group bacterium]|nr:redox-regulated ATPase YchF [Patescibacteria group bacterium]